ncbi:MAG: rod shape-determining protein RodA [Planctomycetota bacterium]|jgi:rod shape determining protein RodA
MAKTFRISNIDWLMIITLIGILAIGNTYLYSASVQSFYTQIKWIILGFLVLITVLQVGYDRMIEYAYSIYFSVILLLIIVLFMRPHRGAQSWIDLPGFSVQPSELAKVAIILALAKYLRNKSNQFTIKGMVIPVIITIIPVALILKQPDLGTAMTILPVLIILLFASGARKSHLFTSLLLGTASLIPMWIFILKQYQKNRILAFLSPEKYEAKEAYQLIMSLIAIGSGGISGAGWREGTSNNLGLLPDRHTDFIFVVVAEEGGFLIAGILLVLFLVFSICGLNAAVSTRDPGGRIVATGATAIISIQAAINIGVVEALLPTTGITLPLVSYGGSSMIASFILIGLILSAGSQNPTVLHRESFLGKDNTVN